jgi:hypothetical protein
LVVATSINDVIYIGTENGFPIRHRFCFNPIGPSRNNNLPFKQHQVPCGQFMVTMMLLITHMT